MVMTRKQVIVQLDDQMVAALDEAAHAEGVSRSELLRRGAEALLEARRIAREERRMVEAYRRLPQDPVLMQALARFAAETAPPYETG